MALRKSILSVHLASEALEFPGIESKIATKPSSGRLLSQWAEMIRKVYEVDPLVCPQCGGTMKVIALIR